jgi:hypothetical protein
MSPCGSGLFPGRAKLCRALGVSDGASQVWIAPLDRRAPPSLLIRGGDEAVAPVGGGAPSLIRKGWWPSHWSRDGNALYVEVGTGENSQRHGRTASLPIGADGLPSESATSVPDAALIPHSELNLSMGSDTSVYAFVKWETRRNIYRIPLRH